VVLKNQLVGTCKPLHQRIHLSASMVRHRPSSNRKGECHCLYYGCLISLDAPIVENGWSEFSAKYLMGNMLQTSAHSPPRCNPQAKSAKHITPKPVMLHPPATNADFLHLAFAMQVCGIHRCSDTRTNMPC
jgi:hypothetical protein